MGAALRPVAAAAQLGRLSPLRDERPGARKSDEGADRLGRLGRRGRAADDLSGISGARAPGRARKGSDHAERLAAALDRFDEADANAILDDAIARFTVDAVVSRVAAARPERDRHSLGER